MNNKAVALMHSLIYSDTCNLCYFDTLEWDLMGIFRIKFCRYRGMAINRRNSENCLSETGSPTELKPCILNWTGILIPGWIVNYDLITSPRPISFQHIFSIGSQNQNSGSLAIHNKMMQQSNKHMLCKIKWTVFGYIFNVADTSISHWKSDSFFIDFS